MMGTQSEGGNGSPVCEQSVAAAGRDRLEHEAFIAMGSNLGDREGYLLQAIDMLNRHESIRINRCSSIYETDPFGYVDQPAFLNMVLLVRTGLEPASLLREMLDIERRLGRVRDIRFGPRTIDLDLLLYQDVTMESDDLILPHPRMHERMFVLAPLSELLALDLQPRAGLAWVNEKVRALAGEGGIALWRKTNWLCESGHFAN